MKRSASNNKKSNTSRSMGPASGQGQWKINFEDIQTLILQMKENDLGQIEWQDGDRKIMVRSSGDSAPLFNAIRASSTVLGEAVGSVPSSSSSKVTASSPKMKQVLSPFVGTFYRAASPTSQPYVTEGQTIKSGGVLCIIEAMKLMNEIECEYSGKVVEILAENGQPVEFGEPLFVIEID